MPSTFTLHHIEKYCAQRSIVVGQYSLVLLNKNGFVAEILKFLIDLHHSNVPGALPLLESIVSLAEETADNDRLFYNRCTEGFAVLFASQKLGAKIQVIEHAQLLSPHRKKRSESCDKSCDFSAILRGEEYYFEVKDFSADQGRLFALSNISENSPLVVIPLASDRAKRIWIESQIRESLRKGANFLIARLPIIKPIARPLVEEDAIKQVLWKYHSISTSEAAIEVRFDIPTWFKGIYLANPRGHVFVRINGNTH